MKILLRQFPVGMLRWILRVFRFTTGIYEQVQIEYYTKLADYNASVKRKCNAEILREELIPVFVLSTGRCGTKTLAALADLMPDVVSHHEPDPKMLEVSYLYFMKLCQEVPENFWQALLAGNRDNLIRQACESSKIYFETNNRLALLCELLISQYPKAKFIHIIRHPCDFVRSAMRRNYFNSHPWDFVRISPSPLEETYKSWNDFSQIDKCAWLWTKTNSHIDIMLKDICEDRKLFLRSEDIFNNIGDSVQALFSFITNDKKMPDASKIEKVLGMKLNQQTSGIFPKSEDWSSEEKTILQHHCGILAKKYGYDF